MIDLTTSQTSSAERVIVGVCLKRQEYVRRIMDSVRPSDFVSVDLRTAYEAILRLHDQKIEPDLVLVDAEIERTKPGAKLTSLLIECAELDYLAANVDHYCGIVRDASQRRSVKQVAEQLIANVLIPDSDVNQVVDAAKAALGTVVQVRGSWKSTSDVLLETYEDIEKRAKGQKQPCISGIAQLDAMTGGFMPGEFTIIGARPSVGKTALAINIAISSSVRGKHVGFVSAEMTTVQVGSRLLSDAGDINGMRMRRPECMEDADWAALADGMGRYSHLPIEWLFKHRHIEDIIAQARWQYERGMCECLIVDYIQMLDTRARFNAAEDRLRVGYISKMLADTAKDLEIPVIGLAQLTRQSGGHSIMPQLSSLKDSGSQEQDADGVILIHEPDWDGDDSLNDREKAIFNGLRDSKSQRLKVFNVAKQRMGEKGTVAAIYDGSRNRFAALER